MKEILINNMYNENPKAYANEGKNIIHEIINLFKADDGNHYIYIVRDGIIATEHYGNISSILLTRTVGNNTVEIIAKIEHPIQLIDNSKTNNREKLYDKQKEYINNIKYNGICIDKIFEDNTYKGKEEKSVIYATFKSETVKKPIKPIYLTWIESNKKHPNTYFIHKKASNQGQRLFINEKSDDYELLNYIIKDKDGTLWEKEDSTVSVKEYLSNRKHNTCKEDYFNFLKLIHHEYYEPAFSNLFQYYFLQNKNVFKKFAKEILKVDVDVNSENFEIKREEYNIDILIRDDKNVIVIENKIKSGINGVKYDDYGDVVQSQLEKYYKYAIGEDNTKEDKYSSHYYDKNRKPHFFIFAPDYKNLDLKGFETGKYYIPIKYSKIYNFYKAHTDDFEKVLYFKDFLNALYKHTLSVDSELYDTMLNRFVSAIQKSERKLYNKK